MTLLDNLSEVSAEESVYVSILMFELLTAALQPLSLFEICLSLLPCSLCFPHGSIPIHAINSNSQKKQGQV